MINYPKIRNSLFSDEDPAIIGKDKVEECVDEKILYADEDPTIIIKDKVEECVDEKKIIL